MSIQLRRMSRAIIILMVLSSQMGACSNAPVQVTSTPATAIPTVTPLPFPKTIDLSQELKIQGYGMAAHEQDCPSLLEGMPGGIVLGVDPKTCLPGGNDHTHFAMEIDIPAEYLKQIFLLKIAWPNEKDRGLRANAPQQTALILLDGEGIWKKSTLPPVTNSFYYAARTEPVLVTFIPGSPGKHKLEFSLSPMMTWDIDSIQITTAPYPSNIMGIAYSPYRDCQSADTEDQPSYGDVTSDLVMLRHGATAIRTYSSTGIHVDIVNLANKLDIPVYAGAWLDGDLTVDDREMDGIISLAQNAHLEAVIIGNEYHLRHKKKEPNTNIDYLLSKIQAFKNLQLSVPVGTAEVDSEVFKWSEDGTPTINPAYKPVLDQIDILFIHIYPFWAGLPVEGAAAYTVDHYLAIKSLLDQEYGGTKRVIIGEAGWPDQGGPGYGSSGAQSSGSSSQPVFHPEAQRQYMLELLALAQEKQVDLFYFDAFDELWKTEGIDGAGRSWGYYYADRTAKYNFSSLLLPPDRMPSPLQGDVYAPYSASNFTWDIGSYPLYTEWPTHPTGKPDELPFQPYAPAYMGNQETLRLDQCSHNSHSGETAIEVDYQPNQIDESGLQWSGAYWLLPKDNWGTVETGNDLLASHKLTFWARGKEGGEVVEFVTGGICGKYDGETPPLCPDTIQPRISTNPIMLTDQWAEYTFDLNDKDRSNVIGAFGFSVSQIYNPDGATLYIDDITFSPNDPVTGETVFPAPMGPTFNIYSDYTSLDNHYIPSNYMGDGALATSGPGLLNLTPDWKVNPHSGETAIKIEYLGGLEGWAGIYWTDPENNWGQRPGGYDLTGVTRLTFWARSDSPSQRLEILIGGIGCTEKADFPYHDSVCNKISIPIVLKDQWKQHTIGLSGTGRDWSQLLGGFGFVTTDTGTFYLDDIVYELNK